MEFPAPPAEIAGQLQRTTGPLFHAIALALAAAPCRERTACKDGLTGRGFVEAADDLCALIGDRPTHTFRDNLLTVLFEMSLGRTDLGGMEAAAPSLDCANPFGGAEDDAFEVFCGPYVETPTYRLLAAVLRQNPGCAFCGYIAAAIPTALRPRVDYQLYSVLERACVLIEILGPGRLSIQLTAADQPLPIS